MQLLSTVSCVKTFIKAATKATDHHLPDVYLTVGRSIPIDHEAPSYLGTTVTFRAKLTRIEGNKLFYELSAWDHQGNYSDRNSRKGRSKMRNPDEQGKRARFLNR